jgi:8-oxo-dGTP diphosphatase
MSREYVNRVGVQCFVLRDGGILLGRRVRVFGAGSWGLPGGKLEQGESVFDAARRELYEETGVRAIPDRIVAVADPTAENNFQLQLGVLMADCQGTPTVADGESCDDLRFFLPADLPTPIFVASEPLLRCLFSGVLYDPSPSPT